MKLFTATAISLLVLASTSTDASEATVYAATGGGSPMSGSVVSNEEAPTLTITRSGSQTSSKGSARYFTGTARIYPLFQPKGPSRTAAASVTFEPSARTAWHTHPLGQSLIVTAGTGWVQQAGGIKQEIKPGDVISIPPGVMHWHGATATSGMTHIALQESLDGKFVDWMDKVTDEQYEAPISAE